MKQTYSIQINDSDPLEITCQPYVLLILQMVAQDAGHKFSYRVIVEDEVFKGYHNL